MTLAEFDEACDALKGASLVVQWKGAHVWKVGGRMFAVAFRQRAVFALSLKASEMARQAYAGQPGIVPAPYLARAGWLRIEDGAMPDADIADMIRVSHLLVINGLPKKQRAGLDLN